MIDLFAIPLGKTILESPNNFRTIAFYYIDACSTWLIMIIYSSLILVTICEFYSDVKCQINVPIHKYSLKNELVSHLQGPLSIKHSFSELPLKGKHPLVKCEHACTIKEPIVEITNILVTIRESKVTSALEYVLLHASKVLGHTSVLVSKR